MSAPAFPKSFLSTEALTWAHEMNRHAHKEIVDDYDGAVVDYHDDESGRGSALLPVIDPPATPETLLESLYATVLEMAGTEDTERRLLLAWSLSQLQAYIPAFVEAAMEIDDLDHLDLYLAYNRIQSVYLSKDALVRLTDPDGEDSEEVASLHERVDTDSSLAIRHGLDAFYALSASDLGAGNPEHA